VDGPRLSALLNLPGRVAGTKLLEPIVKRDLRPLSDFGGEPALTTQPPQLPGPRPRYNEPCSADCAAIPNTIISGLSQAGLSFKPDVSALRPLLRPAFPRWFLEPPCLFLVTQQLPEREHVDHDHKGGERNDPEDRWLECGHDGCARRNQVAARPGALDRRRDPNRQNEVEQTNDVPGNSDRECGGRPY